jgi:hypothetical protein
MEKRKKEIIGVGEIIVGNYPDHCDLCGKRLEYSPKHIIFLKNGKKTIATLCLECTAELKKSTTIKCERCKHFKKDDILKLHGVCKHPWRDSIYVAKDSCCSFFEEQL